MRTYWRAALAVLMVAAIAAPAFADVEFKYGGQFRVRIESEDNVLAGADHGDVFGKRTGVLDDNRNWVDQRLRLYFTFEASKNLKVVSKFELGDTTWGDGGGTKAAGTYAGGNVGADSVIFECKNAYLDFAIPNTPTRAILGIQTITLMDSWIIDDDFSAAVFRSKFDPFGVTVGYIGAQNTTEVVTQNTTATNQIVQQPYTDQAHNVDDFFLAVDYAGELCGGKIKSSFVAFYQDGHNTAMSFDPNTLNTPFYGYIGQLFGTGLTQNGSLNDYFLSAGGPHSVKNNNLFDLGLNLSYKLDAWSAYVSYVQNLGSIQVQDQVAQPSPNYTPGGAYKTWNYQGFMMDAGVAYDMAPWTFNLGGFYTSGPKLNSHGGIDGSFDEMSSIKNQNVTWFTYPEGNAKYFSEIIGGGILEDSRYCVRGYPTGTVQGKTGLQNVFWRGYGFPTNLFTVTTGSSWQVAPDTKISASYWYFGTAQGVPVRLANPSNMNAGYDMSNSIGNELDLYVDQNVVDGLVLTLVGAYLFADDAFAPVPTNVSQQFSNHAADAYKVGARLQWNF